jgi:hypothetical protein
MFFLMTSAQCRVADACKSHLTASAVISDGSPMPIPLLTVRVHRTSIGPSRARIARRTRFSTRAQGYFSHRSISRRGIDMPALTPSTTAGYPGGATEAINTESTTRVESAKRFIRSLLSRKSPRLGSLLNGVLPASPLLLAVLRKMDVGIDLPPADASASRIRNRPPRLSSTTRMCAAAGPGCLQTGIANRKVDPCPGSDSTQIRPR